MDTRHHFFRKKDGQAPRWCSTRTNRSGTMKQWIADLRKTFVVTKVKGQPMYILSDKA